MSRLLAYVEEAFEAIWRNRTRSLLTMLGMIVGTSSIIAVLGISKAASGGITATLNSLGDPGISVNVDPDQDDLETAQIQPRDARTIEAALGKRLSDIEPNYQRNYTLRTAGQKYTTVAVSGSGYHPDTLKLLAGRRLTARDVESGAHVCLLGNPLAQRFFPAGGALGAEIRVGGSRCTVIGIYAEIGGGIFSAVGASDFIELPYPMFEELQQGSVDALLYYPAPGEDPVAVSNAVIAELQRLHGPRAKYTVQNNSEQIKGFNTVLAVVAAGLTAIGGVALLVAGIGIMNIMLVSVTERTREIGLRKSIGASQGDIALQFLLEAILLSLIGGGLGMLLGLGGVLAVYSVIERFTGPAPIPYLLIVSVAVGFSTLVGTVFGTWPAIRASRMDPIAALRS